MSMTREGAIAVLEESKRQNEIMKDNPSIFWASHQMADGVKNAERRIAALDLALTALRPVSREQAETVWGVGAWETVADEGFVDTMGRQVFHLHCPVCDFFWRETGHKKYFRFCPHCGAAQTDEAVEMVMERMEALHDNCT